MKIGTATIFCSLSGLVITAPIVPVPGQYYHAPDSWASEVQIEDGRIKNTLPLDMTVQPNKPTPYNLKRIRVPYSRYSGQRERDGTIPTTEIVEQLPPVEKPPSSPSLNELREIEDDERFQELLTDEIEQREVHQPLFEDDHTLMDENDQLERYKVKRHEEPDPVSSGYKQLLKEAQMGRLDKKSGKGKSKRELLDQPDGIRHLEMRDYAQRMIDNVVKERKAMSEGDIERRTINGRWRFG